MRRSRGLLLMLLLTHGAWASMVHGRLDVADLSKLHDVSVRLFPVGPAPDMRVAPVRPDGSFDFRDVPAGLFLLEAKFGYTRFLLKQTRVPGEEPLDVGAFPLPITVCGPPSCFADPITIPPPPQVLDVCSALKELDRILFERVIIVGAIEDTATGPALVGHCGKQRTASGYRWQSAFGLPGLSRVTIPDLSAVSDWKRIPDPEGQLARSASEARRSTRRLDTHVVAVDAVISSEALLASRRMALLKGWRRSCPVDIQYPAADLVEIQGLRELN